MFSMPRVRYMRLIGMDRRTMKSRWKRFNKNPIKKAGNYVRVIARNSIRRGRLNRAGKRVPSRAPRPPKSWVPGKNPPFKRILSVPNIWGTQAIVGMQKLQGAPGSPVPGRHEHGGTGTAIVPIGKGRTRKVRARYRKRAFMEPAKQRALPKLPSFWKDALTK